MIIWILLNLIILGIKGRRFQYEEYFPFKCQQGTYENINAAVTFMEKGTYLYVANFPIWLPNGTFKNTPFHFYFDNDSQGDDTVIWMSAKNEVLTSNCTKKDELTDYTTNNYLWVVEASGNTSIVKEHYTISGNGCTIYMGQMIWYCGNQDHRMAFGHSQWRLNTTIGVICIENDYLEIYEEDGEFRYFINQEEVRQGTEQEPQTMENATMNCSDYTLGYHNAPLTWQQVANVVI